MIVEHRGGDWTPNLNDAEKQTLFAIAEDTLRWCTRGERKPFPFDAYTLTPKLKEPTATFVTLKIGDRLRGCIGSLTPQAPLYRSVHDNAVLAALRDHRFRPVTTEDVPRIDIHVSILSPMREIAKPEEFKIGEHGIVLEKGPYRSVYLPEVAVEQGWTREQTLDSLSEKAGLPARAWREGARFKVFSSVALARE